MATVQQNATLDDLDRTEGKAELIGGRIVQFMAEQRLSGTWTPSASASMSTAPPIRSIR